MNIVSMLNENAQAYCDKACFIERKATYTYKSVLEQVKKVRQNLIGFGIKKDIQLILLEPISSRLYILMMALWSLGATVVVFDPSATDEYIEKCLERINANYFIGCKKAMLLRFKLKSIRRIPHAHTVDAMMSFITDIDDLFSPVELSEDSPALITFTSGRTGNPKVAVRTHGFLLKQYEVIVSTMDYQDTDMDLAVLAIFTLVNMARGITTVIPSESLSDIAKINSRVLVQQMFQTKVTRITTSPMLLKRVIDYAFAHHIVLPSMRRLNIGGGPVFPFMLNNMNAVFPNATLYLVYGSTEAEPIAEIKNEDIQGESIAKMQQGYGLIGGYVVNQIECKVIKNNYTKTIGTLTNNEFSELILEHEAGEIVVSGGHVLGGYLNGVGDDENKFKVDNICWHRTGDMGVFDEENRLWLLGRSSATIQDARGIVYPFAVESAVYAKYQVNRCAVLQYQGKRILVVESNYETKNEIDKDKGNLKIDQVIRLRRIPLDIRHRSKIDYGKLINLIQKDLR